MKGSAHREERAGVGNQDPGINTGHWRPLRTWRGISGCEQDALPLEPHLRYLSRMVAALEGSFACPESAVPLLHVHRHALNGCSSDAGATGCSILRGPCGAVFSKLGDVGNEASPEANNQVFLGDEQDAFVTVQVRCKWLSMKADKHQSHFQLRKNLPSSQASGRHLHYTTAKTDI